jgi:hypothetical protein
MELANYRICVKSSSKLPFVLSEMPVRAEWYKRFLSNLRPVQNQEGPLSAGSQGELRKQGPNTKVTYVLGMIVNYREPWSGDSFLLSCSVDRIL